MRKAVIRELQFLSILRTARSSVYYQQSRGAAPNVLTYDRSCARRLRLSGK